MRHTTRRFWTTAGVVALSLAALVPVVAQRGGGPGGGGRSRPSITRRASRGRLHSACRAATRPTGQWLLLSGTLGALVQNAGGQFILSNSHVFAQDVEGEGLTSRRSATPSTSPGSWTSPVWTGPTITSPRSRRCRRSTLDLCPPWTPRSRQSCRVRSRPAERFSRSARSAPRRRRLSEPARERAADHRPHDQPRRGAQCDDQCRVHRRCAGPEFTTTYTGQIIVSNRGPEFIAGGDSGSLMVEDVRPIRAPWVCSSPAARASPSRTPSAMCWITSG